MAKVDESSLLPQNLETLDVSKLTPATPEVVSRQATINIGTIGHVAHGKSTVVRSISGVQTVRFQHEKERNCTIFLGYANAKIFKCTNPNCVAPGCYTSGASSSPDDPQCKVPGCEHKMELKRHVSFVDCPGHDFYMGRMLNGAAVMDGALLLIAGNESCPQPQTSEHLAAVEIMQLKHIIIIQNKVELVKEDQAMIHYDEIKSFVSGTAARNAPVIPMSAVLKFNTDVLCEYICTQIPIPVRDFTSTPQMIIIRSFDVNKPGEEAENMKGGIAGGSLLMGVLKVGDEIEVRPGVVSRPKDMSQSQCRPVRSRIVSLFAEQNSLQFAVPGGLIGVGTKIDPVLTRGDKLVGQVLGHPGQLPAVFNEIDASTYLLRRLLGVKVTGGDARGSKVKRIAKADYLLVNIGSTAVGARVKQARNDDKGTVKLELQDPVCATVGAKIAISRKVEKHWRLIGWGEIIKGKQLATQEPY